MSRLDDLIEEMRQDGREDDAKELEQLSGSELRKKAGDAEKLRKENEGLKAQVEKIEALPKRDKAFRDYGIDLDNLSKAERRVLESYEGDLEKDSIAEFVEEFEIPLLEETEGEKSEETEKPAAERIARQAQKNASGRGVPVIKANEANEWSTEKLLRFREQHPEEYEALKRGETVTGVPAPA